MRRAAARRRAGDPLLRAQPGAGDAGGARRAARRAALGAGRGDGRRRSAERRRSKLPPIDHGQSQGGRAGAAAPGAAKSARQTRASSEQQTADARLRRSPGSIGLRGRRRDRRRRSPPAAAAAAASGDAHINQRERLDQRGRARRPRPGPRRRRSRSTNLKEAAKKAGCDLRLHLKDEGHTHIPPGAPTPDYKTNPPTSGNHVEPPYQQADGAYSEMPRGNRLRPLARARPDGDPVQPRPARKGPAGAEGPLRHDVRRRRCSSPTTRCPTRSRRRPGPTCSAATNTRARSPLDAIRAFGKATWGKYGGEPVNAFPLHRPDAGRTANRAAAASAGAGRRGRSRRRRGRPLRRA